MLQRPQRIRRFACLKDYLLTLTWHLVYTKIGVGVVKRMEVKIGGSTTSHTTGLSGERGYQRITFCWLWIIWLYKTIKSGQTIFITEDCGKRGLFWISFRIPFWISVFCFCTRTVTCCYKNRTRNPKRNPERYPEDDTFSAIGCMYVSP